MISGIRTYREYYTKVSEKPLSQSKFLEILNGFYKFFGQKVLEGNLMQLPKFGNIFIIGKKSEMYIDKNNKIKGLPIDWRRTLLLWRKDPVYKEQKKYVYHTNEHTNGFRYKVMWHKSNMFVPGKQGIIFKPVRNISRSVWKNILNGVEYFNYESND